MNNKISIRLESPAEIRVSDQFIQEKLMEYVEFPPVVKEFKLSVVDSAENNVLQVRADATVMGQDVILTLTFTISSVQITKDVQVLDIFMCEPVVEGKSALLNLGLKAFAPKIRNFVIQKIEEEGGKLGCLEGAFPNYKIDLMKVDALQELLSNEFEGISAFDLIEVNKITCADGCVSVWVNSVE